MSIPGGFCSAFLKLWRPVAWYLLWLLQMSCCWLYLGWDWKIDKISRSTISVVACSPEIVDPSFQAFAKGFVFFFFSLDWDIGYILWPMKLTSCYLSFTLRCDVQCHLVEDLPKVLSVTPRKHRSFPMISGLVLPHDSGEWTTGAEAKWRYSWRLKIRNDFPVLFA